MSWNGEQLTCGDLHARGQEVLGVAGRPALPLPELLQVINLHDGSTTA